jgi:hypothetical protein
VNQRGDGGGREYADDEAGAAVLAVDGPWAISPGVLLARDALPDSPTLEPAGMALH